jgi:hypothetical protein
MTITKNQLTGREETACAIFTNACHIPWNKVTPKSEHRNKTLYINQLSLPFHQLHSKSSKRKLRNFLTYRTKLNKSCSKLRRPFLQHNLKRNRHVVTISCTEKEEAFQGFLCNGTSSAIARKLLRGFGGHACLEIGVFLSEESVEVAHCGPPAQSAGDLRQPARQQERPATEDSGDLVGIVLVQLVRLLEGRLRNVAGVARERIRLRHRLLPRVPGLARDATPLSPERARECDPQRTIQTPQMLGAPCDGRIPPQSGRR